jgi:hypothetical protein
MGEILRSGDQQLFDEIIPHSGGIDQRQFT